MSYSTWGTNEYEINEDIILKIAPDELTAFKNALDEADFTCRLVSVVLSMIHIKNMNLMKLKLFGVKQMMKMQ